MFDIVAHIRWESHAEWKYYYDYTYILLLGLEYEKNFLQRRRTTITTSANQTNDDIQSLLCGVEIYIKFRWCG